MNVPKVSVVVPIYNTEEYLDRCIASIVNQTYKNIEVILVDDGSSDGSASKCEEWAKRDIRVKSFHKENGGAGMARNTGMAYSTGQYIMFVDSDDYIDCTAIEKCVSSSLETDSDIVLFGRTRVNKNGEKEKVKIVTDEYFFKGDSVREDLFPGLLIHEKGFGISACEKLYKASVLKNIRFYSEREVLSEDALFTLALFNYVSSVSIIPENMYYYYCNESSFSRSFKTNYREMCNKFYLLCNDAISGLKYSAKVLRYIKSRYHIYMLAGMKQIVALNVKYSKKKSMLKAFFEDELLRESLVFDTFSTKKPLEKLFWGLFKIRFYTLCYFLLWCKTR